MENIISLISLFIAVIDLYINYKGYVASLSQNKKESDEIKPSSSFTNTQLNKTFVKDVTIINIYINNK